MRFAVTGATGFVGGALARRLLADGHEVVVPVRTPAKAAALRDAGAVVTQADLADPASESALAAAFDGCDGVFHVAGWYKIGSPDPAQGWRVNVGGTQHTLAAATLAGVPRVVYTSTLAVNSDTGGRTVDESYLFRGTHRTTYDETKASAHADALAFAAANSTPQLVIVMPGGIYGPGDTSQIGAVMADVAARKRVLVSSKLRMMQAHVDDIVTGHILAMADGVAGESYMLAGERTDLWSMLVELAAITHGHRPIDMPGPLLVAGERLAGLAGRVLPIPATYSAEALRSSQGSYLGTSAKARRELGWTFRGLHEGLRQTAEAEGWV